MRLSTRWYALRKAVGQRFDTYTHAVRVRYRTSWADTAAPKEIEDVWANARVCRVPWGLHRLQWLCVKDRLGRVILYPSESIIAVDVVPPSAEGRKSKRYGG